MSCFVLCLRKCGNSLFSECLSKFAMAMMNWYYAIHNVVSTTCLTAYRHVVGWKTPTGHWIYQMNQVHIVIFRSGEQKRDFRTVAVTFVHVRPVTLLIDSCACHASPWSCNAWLASASVNSYQLSHSRLTAGERELKKLSWLKLSLLNPNQPTGISLRLTGASSGQVLITKIDSTTSFVICYT